MQQELDGDVYQFTEEGWFNATQAAKRFGKRVDHFLANQETIDYMEKLRNQISGDLVISSKARVDRGGGTWLHPKLAAPFARWLDTLSFYNEVLNHINEFEKLLQALNNFEVPDEVKEVYEERNETLYVYAIREEGTGNIKLGISTNPERRLAQLQTGNSSQLSLIGMRIAVDGYRTERRIQEANKQHHIHNEWYTEQATLEVENE